MKMNKVKDGLVIELYGDEGRFNSTKSISLFKEHITQKDLKDIFPLIKNEIKNFRRLQINILPTFTNYTRGESKKRFLVDVTWCELETRNYNGRDYSEKDEFIRYDNKNKMLNDLIKRIEKEVRMEFFGMFEDGQIPEVDSLYALSLR